MKNKIWKIFYEKFRKSFIKKIKIFKIRNKTSERYNYDSA